MTAARALACALALAACRSDGGATAAVNEPGDAATARALGERIPAQRRGVPHAGSIDLIAIPRDGSAAVTRDHLGGVRVWPTLDGSREPLVLPLRGARDLAVEVARSPGGERELRVAAITPASSVRQVVVFADGSVRELPAATPPIGARQIELLPGGDLALALGTDHRLVLIDHRGQERAALEARRFRPELVLVDESGRLAVAFERSGTGAIAHRIAVDVATPALRRIGEPIDLGEVPTIARGRVALAPDGARVAFFAAPPAPDADPATPAPSGAVGIVELEGGARRDVRATLPADGHRALGFASAYAVVASASPLGGTWRIDVTAGRAEPRVGPVDQDQQHAADAFARGVRVGADGGWLYVERGDAGALYLGYPRFQPLFAAVSPSGEHAALGNLDGSCYVVPGDGGPTVRLESPPADPVVRAVFVDDEHLVTAGSLGGLRLVHWPSQTTIAAANAGGAIGDLEADPGRGLVRVARSPQGTVLFEVSAAGFGGAHVIADGSYRSGFLAGDAVLWTLDARNILRRYGLGELREGLDHEQLLARGEPVSSATELPVNAVDERGRVYSIARGPGSVTVKWRQPDSPRPGAEFASGASPVVILPAPGAERVAIIDASGLLSVFAGGGGEPLWTRSFGPAGPGTVAWSADGRRLVTGSAIGSLVLDAATGEAVQSTCGPWFEARPTPPQLTMGVIDRANLCEE